MTQLLESRLPMVKSGLGLDRTLLIEEGSMHRKPLIPRYPSVLRRQYPPETGALLRRALTASWPGARAPGRDSSCRSRTDKACATTQYIPIVTLARAA